MRIQAKIAATALAIALATSSMSPPAAAYKRVPPPPTPSSTNITAGKIVVGCIFGSALGLILAALAKGQAYKSKTVELTQEQAYLIAFTCGLGTFPVIANFPRTN